MIMTATTLSKNGNPRNPTKPAALRAVRVKQHWKNTKSQRRTLNVLNRNLIDNTGAVLCNLGHLVSIMAGYDPEISAGTFKEHRHYFSLFTLNPTGKHEKTEKSKLKMLHFSTKHQHDRLLILHKIFGQLHSNKKNETQFTKLSLLHYLKNDPEHFHIDQKKGTSIMKQSDMYKKNEYRMLVKDVENVNMRRKGSDESSSLSKPSSARNSNQSSESGIDSLHSVAKIAGFQPHVGGMSSVDMGRRFARILKNPRKRLKSVQQDPVSEHVLKRSLQESEHRISKKIAFLTDSFLEEKQKHDDMINVLSHGIKRFKEEMETLQSLHLDSIALKTESKPTNPDHETIKNREIMAVMNEINEQREQLAEETARLHSLKKELDQQREHLGQEAERLNGLRQKKELLEDSNTRYTKQELWTRLDKVMHKVNATRTIEGMLKNRPGSRSPYTEFAQSLCVPQFHGYMPMLQDSRQKRRVKYFCV